MNRTPFLSAHWKNLLVVNYEIDPIVLEKHVPKGTSLDFFDGKCFVSLVAFMFENNKLWGLIPTIPHVNFEEANLRFYIKREEEIETKKAVAFIREVVPSGILAWTARTFYNEPYVKLPMKHSYQDNKISYTWGNNDEYFLKATMSSDATNLEEGSYPFYILEHYWGYTPQKDGSTFEYEVEHPPWEYYEVNNLEVSEALASFYGEEFQEALSKSPHSAFVAKGSDIKVHFPTKIT